MAAAAAACQSRRTSCGTISYTTSRASTCWSSGNMDTIWPFDHLPACCLLLLLLAGMISACTGTHYAALCEPARAAGAGLLTWQKRQVAGSMGSCRRKEAPSRAHRLASSAMADGCWGWMAYREGRRGS